MKSERSSAKPNRFHSDIRLNTIRLPFTTIIMMIAVNIFWERKKRNKLASERARMSEPDQAKTIDLLRFTFEMYNPNCILNDQSNQIDKEIEHQMRTTKRDNEKKTNNNTQPTKHNTHITHSSRCCI